MPDLTTIKALIFPRYGRLRRDVRARFDAKFYLERNVDVAAAGNAPLAHFITFGWREGRSPSAALDTQVCLKAEPELAKGDFATFWARLTAGASAPAGSNPASVRPQDRCLVASEFDGAWYRACFADGTAPQDPLEHYLSVGWREGRDPTQWFSGRHYLARNPDVVAAGVNPFLHYLTQGRKENRPLPPRAKPAGSVFDAQAFATAPGPGYEDFDIGLATRAAPRAKVLAYYLPQFHATPENDKNWGAGFTEWRNVTRGLPRYRGHIQPRIPRDLGFYSLDAGETYRRQIELAAAAGIHGFCFYYYWFNGRRVLDAPVERMLSDPTLDFPFTLMWANENWTRTWDGHDKQVLLKQDYDPADDAALVADLARHFADPRYMRIGDRPLFFLYRPGQIPDARARIAAWRAAWRDDHGVDPVITMVQGFGDLDPRMYGLDGAIEFPPHKLAEGLKPVNNQLDMIDPTFSGHAFAYDDLVAAAQAEPVPDFPLIRCAVPGWDNEARRPGRGMSLAGATPDKFANWIDHSVAFAQQNPFHGEPIVAVNAWNEWAEGAYLEPDVHHGAAFLNALSAGVRGIARTDMSDVTKVLLVGHDACQNGAQMLLLHIAERLARSFGIKLHILLAGGGPLLDDYRAIADVTVINGDAETQIARLAGLGFVRALTNTTATGDLVPLLKAAGIRCVSLVHELPRLIESCGLGPAAAALGHHADHVVFPAAEVRHGFESIAGLVKNKIEIRPQGLYRDGLLALPRCDGGLRAELGLPVTTRLVIGMGFADLRKGIDRFINTALAMCAKDEALAFIWIGDAAPAARDWHLPDVAAAGLSDRIRLTGHIDDPARWLQAADLFFMTSREDPFPSVVLEALALGLPVVGYAGTGGCDDLIRRHGALVRSDDPLAAPRAIRRMLNSDPVQAEKAATARRAEIATNFQFDDYVFGLAQLLIPDLPDVAVIVPNYNYARYLPDRLSSIFAQTLPVREVLVLDDASPDDSLKVIATVSRQAQRDVSVIANDQNSGSPFVQWRKGVARAQGEYVWIAEADDVADPSFLARLARRMATEGAVLGFCDSWQIDGADAKLGDSYRNYLNDIEPGAFDRSFVMAGDEFLQRFLSVKNVILNVSGALFQRKALLAALAATRGEVETLNVAGDWRLYAEICASGGKIVYDRHALNGHRRHATSVTHALKAETHLREIVTMQKIIARRLPLSDDALDQQRAHLLAARDHILSNSGSRNVA